jgi:Tol biopolymer transport system component
MRQASPGDNSNRLIEQGSPFYWAWSPDSQKLVMHVGDTQATTGAAHLSIVENQENAQRVELKLTPGFFQAPTWSQDGQNIFYVAANDEGADNIYRMDMDTLAQYQVTDLAGVGRTYMVVSPNGEHLAYMESDPTRPIPLGKPYLIEADGQNWRPLTNRAVMSMYWSPDSTKLALLTAGVEDREPSAAQVAPAKLGLGAPLLQPNIVFRWWVYDLATETLESLVTIEPTAEFMQTVPYFDQYHLSLTFWSPDSRFFVATTAITGEAGGRVLVLDTTGQTEPRDIGAGTLGIWSWR